MDLVTIGLIQGISGGYFTHFSAKAVESLFKKVFQRAPALEKRLQSARTTHDVEAIFRESIGVIDAHAADGSINIDGALLNAMRGMRFDHANGTVTVSGSVLSAPVLVTGGQPRATGATIIKGSSMRSARTSIEMNEHSSIKMTGASRIIQN